MPGGIEDDGNIRAGAGGDHAVEPGRERGVLRERGAAVCDDGGDRMQAFVIIAAQSPRLVIEHVRERRQAIRNGEKLVDLFLVLHGGIPHLGMRQHEGKLVRDSIGIDRHRHGAKHLRRHDRPVELRPVGPDHRDAVAARDTEPRQPGRESPHLRSQLRPGPALPDAELLVPHRRTRREAHGIAHQELGEGVKRVQFIHHSLFPPGLHWNGNYQ